VVSRLGDYGYTTEIMAGRHGIIADESEKLGGNDFGPSPYELLSSALAACTAMTLQMYARRKEWDLEEVKVHINHGKDYRADCADCDNPKSKVDQFETCIELIGNLSDEQRARLIEIADKCPVHRTLERDVVFKTYELQKTV